MDELGNLHVAVVTLGLHLPGARSLKEKRARIRSLVERTRRRHNVLVIEAGHQELHQRAVLAICAISTSLPDLEARLQRVRLTVEDTWSDPILSWDVDVLEMEG